VPDIASAEIIPFPTRRTPAAEVPATALTTPIALTTPMPANPGAERLVQALAALETALAEQRAAVTDWRNSLAALRCSTNGLGSSLSRLHSGLDTLSTDVSALNGQARALADWADETLERDDRWDCLRSESPGQTNS
jgi:hypothetical protein